jgi:hypothetical protein
MRDHSNGDGSRRRWERRFRVGTDESHSLAVVRAVATVLERQPVELPESLFHVVDPDLLNLLAWAGDPHRPRDISISFVYCGLEVTATTDSVLVVDPRREPNPN